MQRLELAKGKRKRKRGLRLLTLQYIERSWRVEQRSIPVCTVSRRKDESADVMEED